MLLRGTLLCLSRRYSWRKTISSSLYYVGWFRAFLHLNLIWIIADIVNGLMAFPNLIALIGLRKVIIEETKDYFQRLKINHYDQDEVIK